MKKMKLENCGPGCDCGKPSGNKKAKAVLCLIVLLAIGGTFAYKAQSAKQITPATTETAFAAPVAPVNQIEAQRAAAPTVEKQEPATGVISTAPPNTIDAQKAAVPATDQQEPVVKTVEEKKRVGEFLDSLASLNKVAVNQDAVFVFIPAKGNDTVNKQTADAIASAEKRIKSAGVSLGLYTLQSGSPEYANIAAQLPLPGMLVLSKGRGMGALSGEITETKLLQAYVASSQAGGCGPSGCGPAGCN
ncbi:MAG: hypothetical protein JXA81_06265 [Sedimentisphaerales bacterium]|nr:hypothetical protein [Sedimentisphaerales bacterium]